MSMSVCCQNLLSFSSPAVALAILALTFAVARASAVSIAPKYLTCVLCVTGVPSVKLMLLLAFIVMYSHLPRLSLRLYCAAVFCTWCRAGGWRCEPMEVVVRFVA